MSKPRFAPESSFRIFAALFGIGLLGYLVLRTGPGTIWTHVQAVGWGLALIIVLAGVAHLLKTWAWRLTFTCDIDHLSWPRSFAMRLISEAIAQIGIAGKVLGEGVRVSLLGSAVPVANGISSGALDAGLYTLAAAMVTVFGIIAALLLAPASGKWRFYAWLFAIVLIAFVGFVGVAIGRGWRFVSKSARAMARLPRFQNWIARKQSVIDSAEQCLLTFHREAPRAFWASVTLNFLCHALAILEVYIVLKFMGARVTLISALALEGLTKLINLVGTLNPGNVGTYEGGNMLITKIFGITATSGLTLALCRRARAFFWAAIGALCLILMKKLSHQNKTDAESDTTLQESSVKRLEEAAMNPGQQNNINAVIVLANYEGSPTEFSPSLARIGSLPLLLRTILTAGSAGATRILVCVPSATAQHVKSTLRRSGRLPLSVEWLEIGTDTNLCSVIGDVAATSEKVMLLLGNRSYQPRLMQSAMEWKGPGALALATDDELAGIYVLSQMAAVDISNQSRVPIQRLSDLHVWMQCYSSVEVKEVAATSWQEIVTPEDLAKAERKLDAWLVKPTDGLFARTNRKISIPISRQLIKFPITANGVTFLVLGVSIASGMFFARGGYWSILVGAALSLASSILDGCDGEVARLKLQSTKFGCWLETICDDLYYLFVFGGMAVGLTRSSGTHSYLAWGGLLGFGAIMSFIATSYIRQRLSGSEPEKFLSVWQKKADARPSNPLLYIGRNCEFIIRRCFFPYALLFFAIVNMTKFAFIATALGANIVWLIALYSAAAFSRKRSTVVVSSASPAAMSAAGD